MARQNDGLVYPESKLTICRSLTNSGKWEVRSPLGFEVVKEPTEKGGSRTVYRRVEQEGAVLELCDNGAKARLAAVRLAVQEGLITSDEGSKRIQMLTPVKK